jgi:signal transduction histidine kinase
MSSTTPSDAPRPRRRLFWKYVVVIVALVTMVLAASAGVELWFTYRENQDALVALQREKAGAAATRIEAFIREIEHQMGWTTQPLLVSGPAALEQRRIDFLRLLRQVPPITELSYLDKEGKEQLRVSRLAMDVTGSANDLSADARFTQTIARRVYHGPVYFRKESEPYMVLAMAQSGGGVTVAEVNLKFIWDVVTQIKIGKAGRAYVADERGNLIAHPDISLVLQKTSLATLPQVREAISGQGEGSPLARDVQGRRVLTAHATIPGLRWVVFAEQPLGEALEPLQASIKRALVLLVVGIALAMAASLALARRMVRPIQALQVGAARIGGGELGHRLEIRSGDELETLAGEFNRMTAHLQESYATLEQRVEDRTRELSESLEQQTATGEILRVISSSPTDVQPVFDAITRSAVRLCEGLHCSLFRFDGVEQHFVAHHGVEPATIDALLRRYPQPPDPGTTTGRAIIARQVIHVPDITVDPQFPESQRITASAGYRAVLAVPMMREERPVGVILVVRREPRAFSDKQVELLKTFADQAVIAIENVRLFTELEAKNAAITESLEQQTATGEILRVISSSPTDVQPVFDAILAKATELCDANLGALGRYDGERYEHLAHRSATPEFQRYLFGGPRVPGESTGLGRMISTRRPVHIPDIKDEAAYRGGDPARVATADIAGARTFLAVPMLKEGRVVGGIVIYRREVRPFGAKQIELVTTFASQAVIAIENVRLFKELEARNSDLTESLEQQTATAEILRVISGSPTDIQPVLEIVAKNAARVCGASDAVIRQVEGDLMTHAVHHGSVPFSVVPDTRRITRDSVSGRAILERRTIHLNNLLDPEFAREYPEGAIIQQQAGYRTIVATPLLREGTAIGVIMIRRMDPYPFTDKQLSLLQTFADQAVIAIENVRLFTELQERTSQLQVASRHKDEFLANMSHELRTPLNAIIGFSEVMIERMFGEINEKQEEYLNDILSSGRHLLSLINDILDLSKIEAGKMELDLADFNLAAAIDNALTLVHERAARRGLTLAQDVDERIGDFRGDERKIKQVLLNLLSNAIKFTPEGGRVDVRAVPKGDVIEISVTDTGVGIAPEDREAVFEEFRQVGTDIAKKHEGTGLGLALTQRFVELHGGNIWLESEVGVGSTFTFALPVRR